MKPQLLLRPEPAPLDGPLRTEKEILRHRRLYCAQYDRCLDESIRRGWQSFTCLRCPLSELAEKGAKNAQTYAEASPKDPTSPSR